MTNYQFNVIEFTESNGIRINGKKRQVNIKRVNESSARYYMYRKFQYKNGFIVELNNSWSV
jgi:hypothetical protein